MAQYQITLDSQTLHQLFMTKSKDSGVSALLESVLNQILKAIKGMWGQILKYHFFSFAWD